MSETTTAVAKVAPVDTPVDTTPATTPPNGPPPTPPGQDRFLIDARPTVVMVGEQRNAGIADPCLVPPDSEAHFEATDEHAVAVSLAARRLREQEPQL